MVSTRYATGFADSGAYTFGYGRHDTLAGTQRGIILVPGGGGTEISWQIGSATQPNIISALMARLCDGHGRRFISIASDWTWGNSVVVDRIGDAIELANAWHSFADKVHLIGVSMGGCCVLNYALRHPEKVASVSMVIPVVDQQDIYDNGRVTPYSLPEPSTAFDDERPPNSWTPARNAAGLRRIPGAAWYSDNDSVCVKETIEPLCEHADFAANNLGDQVGWIPGHAADDLPLDDVAAFIAEND